LDFSIKKCVAWAGDFSLTEDWQAFAMGNKTLAQNDALPGLKQIPAMQRRRLSPYAKLSMHCALEAAEDCLDSVPSVFASRHGDLQKTSKLINDVAAKEVLSPTHFGLSVHNAVGGLFSIFTKNKAPQTAISAGEDTFFCAIIDAVCKLKANQYPQILLVYTETIVPDIYQKYIKQEQVSISTALLIESTKANNFTIDLKANTEVDAKENAVLQAIDFLKFYHSDSSQLKVTSKRHIWTLNRNNI
jgi:hypothetical protein